jgi:predicted TIM-barrel fold metal-dependent hydrolase
MTNETHDLPYPVTDIHVHIQPWAQLHPQTRRVMAARRNNYDELQAMMLDPQAVLDAMDAAGVDRIGMINYVATELMGFTDAVNPWVGEIAAAAPERLLAFGGLDPRQAEVIDDPEGAIDHLVELGIRGLKIHPPHQELRANSYRPGAGDEHLPALAGIYQRAAEVGLPIMIHTGTSIFPGARSRFGDPLECDDVAIDFPDLVLVLAHAGRPFWCEQAIFAARRHPNLHLDLSGIPPKRLLHYLPDLPRLAKKCLWGTDWPGPGVPSLADNLRDFLELGLDDNVYQQVLHDVPEKLFPRRSAAPDE